MRIFGSVWVLVFAAGACYAAPTGFRGDLAAAGIEAVFPGDPNYANYTGAYNERFAVHPAAVTLPNNAHQVAKIVKLGAAYGYPIVARSGGHSYIANGLGGNNGAVVVDLRKFKTITVSSSGIATIQMGNRLGDVAVALNDHGRALPHGTCPYVGIGGHSGYGGWGFTSRMWGLTLDTIQSMDVVLANGTITTISAKKHSDLFWAMRGAAPSFGITTSITVHTFSAPPSATVFEYKWNMKPSEAAKAISTFQQFAKTNVPKEYGSHFAIGKGNAAGELSFTLVGGWYGPENKLKAAIAPFLAQVRQPDSTKFTIGTYINSVEYLGGLGTLSTSAPDSTDTFYAKSLLTPPAEQFSDAALDAFTNYMASAGTQTNLNWFVLVDLFGGTNSAVNSVPTDATAFGHRSSLWALQIYASSPNFKPPYPSSGFTFLDNIVNSLTSNSPPHWDIGAYPNYPDNRLTNWKHLYYGSNYPRLLSVKQKYDPHHVFTFPQTIGS